MNSQFQDYEDPYQSSNRSPNSLHRYSTLNRQPSRHFDNNYNSQLPSMFAGSDDQTSHPARYDHSSLRYDTRMPPPQILPTQSDYQSSYESQTWNYGGANPSLSNLNGASGRMKPTTSRSRLPNTWYDSPAPPPMPSHGIPLMNGGQYIPMQSHQRDPSPDSEELIPTAIVIKNIPFAVKKEQLMDIMTQNRLPLPYAFNYHFDNGVFRGLAFANFTTADETSLVIQFMNNMDLHGRKLKVEYKKMLPAHERDRIEREKRERRGQLQEQHQPQPSSQLHSQNSTSSLNAHIPTTSPSPVSQLGHEKPLADLDLKDGATLKYYLLLHDFYEDPTRIEHTFPPHTPPAHRKTIHTLCHNLGLHHQSDGEGDMRVLRVFKRAPKPGNSLLQSQAYMNSQPRTLARAATTDFSESRTADFSVYNHSLARQGSGMLELPENGMPGAANLRGVKSFADFRSCSPISSNASFPTNLRDNISRYADTYTQSTTSGTPNLTPTSAGGMNRDESYLLNTMSSMNLGSDRPSAGRSTGLGRFTQERESHGTNAGPIGSRPVNGNYDENGRNGASAVPERQPRGPGAEWGGSAGFSRPRQNGHVTRGSDSSDRNGSQPTNSRYL